MGTPGTVAVMVSACGRVALLACCLGAAGCIGPGPAEAAIDRASRELSCSSDKVAIVQRSDVSDSVYDVAACGRRARYACFSTTEGAGTDVPVTSMQCVREPDPPSWDPDPAKVASPHPPGGEVPKICSEGDYGRCLYKENGAWRWRVSSCAGMTCQ